MGGTCYAMGLMLAYNQFSANTSLVTYNPARPAGDAGGNGRRGAQKIIIFETDGAPNTTATRHAQQPGHRTTAITRVRYNSASPGSSEFPTGISGYTDNASTVTTQIYSLCTQLAALDTASPPGYSTPSKQGADPLHRLRSGVRPGFGQARPPQATLEPDADLSATSPTACPATRSSTAPSRPCTNDLQTGVYPDSAERRAGLPDPIRTPLEYGCSQ